MTKRLLLIAFAAAFAGGFGYAANQSSSKVIITVGKTQADNGKQMFVDYCAPCHGLNGRGNGPVAQSLKTPPADLTVLTRDNHGRYPATHIVSVLQAGAPVPAHGTTLMPVWGPIFGKMSTSDPQVRALRISNLSRYVETLQAK